MGRLPLGLCQCGCGRQTRVPLKSDRKNGCKRGRPMRFVRGHNKQRDPHPYRVDAATGCWLWKLTTNEKGYGVLSRYVRGGGQRIIRAHVYFYESKYGPVPRGKELDHTCRTRSCCNPDHVEAVTHLVNIRRGVEARKKGQA